jgi:ABC-type polysaccharide/polyol phosphate transport system ATPase subunit
MLPGVPDRHTDFWALKDIGFEVARSEALSLVTPTAAAKARCYRSSAASSKPTSVRVVTRGRIAALLELGAS